MKAILSFFIFDFFFSESVSFYFYFCPFLKKAFLLYFLPFFKKRFFSFYFSPF